jgi:DNA transposition AAA+ family ATPase
MTGEGLTARQRSIESGVAYGTLTGWLAGTYAGRNDRVAALVARWLAARAEWRNTAGAAAAAPGFLSTPSAVSFTQALQIAQALPDIVAIVGAPGVGKTMACRRYQEANPHVTLITANPSVSGANVVLAAIAEALRLTERNSTRLYRSIGAKLNGAQALIVVDEAQHLKVPAYEQLRALHDEYGIGLAFVGNVAIHSVLSGGAGGSEHAQLSSRFGFRVVQRKAAPEDVEMILDAWEIDGAAERKFLATVAAKPGALRVMNKVIRLAGLLVQGSGRPATVENLRIAYEQQTRSPGAAA